MILDIESWILRTFIMHFLWIIKYFSLSTLNFCQKIILTQAHRPNKFFTYGAKHYLKDFLFIVFKKSSLVLYLLLINLNFSTLGILRMKYSQVLCRWHTNGIITKKRCDGWLKEAWGESIEGEKSLLSNCGASTLIIAPGHGVKRLFVPMEAFHLKNCTS